VPEASVVDVVVAHLDDPRGGGSGSSLGTENWRR
jgi:hypothetical protein